MAASFALASAPLAGSRRFAARVVELVRLDAPLYLLIALYTIAGVGLLALADAPERSAYAIYVGRSLIMFGLIMPAAALILDFLWTMLRWRRRRGLVYARVYSARRMAHFVAGLLLMQAMILFFGTFTSIKNMLPLLHGGFPFDRLQADIDAMLHFSVDPWRLIQPFWGTDAIRAIVEWNYNAGWFIACYGTMFFIVTSPKTARLKAGYMIGFMALWIMVGNVMAGLFLSAGPAFYGHVTGDHGRFAEQVAFLARGVDIPFSAAFLQEYLWTIHQSGRAGMGSGISAFPSMHIALVAYNACFILGWSRTLGIAAFAYAGFVGVSSVYLGWHYAIDGYAAAIVSVAMYLAVTRWRARDAAAGRPPQLAPIRAS